MIQTCPGAVFGTADDGDLRFDLAARRLFSKRAGIGNEWATVRQVHGATVLRVEQPGEAGEADALFTSERSLPLAVFTADCFPVVLVGPDAVGVAHAGWRGAAAGVVERLRTDMTDAGVAPERACVGPGIGPCCFEVGPEVRSAFPTHHATTTWGTPSVDLRGAIVEALAGLDVWQSGQCTRCGSGFFSHRRDRTSARMAGVTWLT
jgi:polyphenol oxidase